MEFVSSEEVMSTSEVVVAEEGETEAEREVEAPFLVVHTLVVSLVSICQDYHSKVSIQKKIGVILKKKSKKKSNNIK